ncbi:hypothetical protein [Zooshikella sp. RANM57]|uniref:hypothetical protein n=1 Tax=Zooshikella sp. RANM57 TaxID=3425863 RepID=UPI003D6DDAB3
MKNITNVNFISGHLDLSETEFNVHYRPAIDQAIARNETFIMGDARGADVLAQQYLLSKTDAVTVYHMHTTPRNNLGFKTIGGFCTDSERDKHMTLASTHDIAWVRPGREHSGTQKNLNRRQKYNTK